MPHQALCERYAALEPATTQASNAMIVTTRKLRRMNRAFTAGLPETVRPPQVQQPAIAASTLPHHHSEALAQTIDVGLDDLLLEPCKP